MHRSLLIVGSGIVLLVAAACGDAPGPPRELTPADLARFAESYDGTRVSTRGTVHRFDDPEHYWIEGPNGHRIAIRPADTVRERVGERVRVVGEFSYDRERGRAIRPSSTEVLD